MTRTRLQRSSIATVLAFFACQIAWSQSEQDNVFNANEGAGGTYSFEGLANWDPDADDSPPWTGNEVDGGISFDLDDDDTYTIDVAESYTSIDTLNILTRTVITLNGTGGAGQSFSFNEDGRIETGDGALEISGLNLYLAGDMVFDYGNGNDDDPAETIDRTFGTNQLAFNLIIDGLVSDNGENATRGTLTFTGGGFALLEGGIDATGTGSSFGIDLKNGSSLMLAGGSLYNLADGVSIGYGDGSEEGRQAGHGILQVTDGATLDTTDAEGGGDIDLSGWGSLLVGSITLNERSESLGFEEHVGTDSGNGTVTTDNMTLGGDSVVIVGDGGTVTGTTVDEGVLTLNGSSTFVIQNNGEITFNELLLNSGDFINEAGTATFQNDSSINGGTFTSSGTTDFEGNLFMDGIFEVLGGITTVKGDAQFKNGTETRIDSGRLNLANATAGVALTTTLDGTIWVESSTGTGRLDIGQDGDDTIDTIQIGSNGRIVVDGSSSEFNTYGNTTIAGELFVQNGATYTYKDESTGVNSQVLSFGPDTIIGGGNEDDSTSYIDLSNYTNTSGALDLTTSTLFGGLVNSETGEFEVGRGTLQITTALDLDLRGGGGMIFALGYDPDVDPPGEGHCTTINIEGGGHVKVDDGTTINLSIGGDEYIPTGTVWTLLNADDIWDGSDWDDVILEGYNTVTRTFTHGAAEGTVEVGTDYVSPLDGGGSSLQQARAGWLQQRSEDMQLPDLLHLFDQVATVEAYQLGLSAMGPTSMTTALQITGDTRTFSVFREALLEMRTTNDLGRPGPARRPLGIESQSLLASQDEGDAIRSQYGYGSSPESGTRRTDGDDMIAFVQGYGRSLSYDNKGDVVGVSGNEWGVLTGIGGQLSNQTILGLLVGYDSFSGDLNDNLGNVDVSTVRVGPFLGWSDGTWNVDAALMGGYDDWRGTRKNPGLGTSHDWKTTGWEIDASLGAGYRIPVGGGVDLIPEGSILYSYIHSDAYQETGGAVGDRLNVQADDMSNIIGRFGLRAQVQTIPGLSIEGRLGWQGNYTFGGNVNADILGIGIPGGSDQVSRNNIYYGAQITYLPRWDIALTIRYEGRGLDGTNDQYIGGGVSFEF